VSIVARSAGSPNAEALARQLEGALVRVVADPGPDDPTRANRLAKEAWLPWSRSATHHLVIPDDVVLHPDFLRQARDAVASQPDAVLSFFAEWGSPASHALRIAAFSGRAWVAQPDTYLSTIAMVMPVTAAAAFSETLDPESTAPDDEAAFAFVRSQGLAHFVSNPNLVQLSSSDGDGGNSRATCFLPDEVAPASWWRGGPLTALPRIPAIDWRSGEPMILDAPVRDGDPWRARPWQESGGPHVRRFTRIVRDRLLCTEVARADLRAAAALLGAATVLSDQLVLAAEFAAAPTDFGESCARESAATLPDGALRQVVGALAQAETAAEIRAAFLAIHDDVRDVLQGLA
jgi:hypothetical protein